MGISMIKLSITADYHYGTLISRVDEKNMEYFAQFNDGLITSNELSDKLAFEYRELTAKMFQKKLIIMQAAETMNCFAPSLNDINLATTIVLKNRLEDWHETDLAITKMFFGIY